MYLKRGWWLQMVSTANYTKCSFLWNWNLEYKDICKLMTLSNFAYLTMTSGFQIVLCRLLDLFLLHLKAGTQISVHALETLTSWNCKKKLKIAVLVTLSLLVTFRKQHKWCCIEMWSSPPWLHVCLGTNPCWAGAISQRRKLFQIKSRLNFNRYKGSWKSALM